MSASQILAGMVTSLEGPALDAAIQSIMAGEKGDEILAGMTDAPEAALIAVALRGSLRARQRIASRDVLPDSVRAILAADRASSVAARFGSNPVPKSRKNRPAVVVQPHRTPAEAIRAHDSTATIAAILDGTFDSDTWQALQEALLVNTGLPGMPAIGEPQRQLLRRVSAAVGAEQAARLITELASTWSQAVDSIIMMTDMYEYTTVDKVADAADELLVMLPGRPDAPLSSLRWETRQFLAALPSTPPDVLTALVSDTDPDVRSQAGSNAGTPLQAVSDAVFDDRALPSFSWVVRMAKMPPDEERDALSDLQPLALLNALASGKPLSAAAYDAAATGPVRLREECAASQLAPARVLELLAGDSADMVARAVQRNDAAPTAAIIAARPRAAYWPAYARVTDEDLPDIPWKVAVAAVEFAGTAEQPERQAVRIRDAVARLMSSAELRTPGAVACMAVLADEYDGTIRGLLEAAENL